MLRKAEQNFKQSVLLREVVQTISHSHRLSRAAHSQTFVQMVTLNGEGTGWNKWKLWSGYRTTATIQCID